MITGDILNKETVRYTKELETLLNANKYKGSKLEISYFPYSFNGRKICTGLNYHHNQKEMIMQLIIADEMDEFIDFLNNKAFPLFQNGSFKIMDYHF